MTYPDANLRTPYVESANLGLQQQLTTNLAMQIMYVGKFGRHQLLDFNSNPALYAPGASTSTSSYQARRLYSNFGNIADVATIGVSSYNALQVSLTKRMTSWLSAMGAYTYSRSIDEFSSNTTDTATVPNVFSNATRTVPVVGSPLNFNLSSETGPSDFNATHIASIGYSVNVPAMHRFNRFVQLTVGGWILSGRYGLRSGEPINIVSGTDFADTNSPNQRPLVWHNWVLPPGRHRLQKLALTGGTYFDPTALCGSDNPACSTSSAYLHDFPAPGTFGTLGRNAVIGPASISNNMSLAKTFPIRGVRA